MKKLTVGGKEYTLEYSIGASLYEECVTSVVSLLGSAAMDDDNDESKEAMLERIGLMGGIPKVAATVLYAGLLEHHGTGEYASDSSDGSIPDKRAVLGLFRTFNEEHKESGDGSWMDIFNLCLECMGDDDFFGLIGLNQLMEQATPKKRTRKKAGEK